LNRGPFGLVSNALTAEPPSHGIIIIVTQLVAAQEHVQQRTVVA